ncbi:MAG: 2,3-bisphosphoglycerate-independent phosphoglycerate mutase [Chloroflexota bacterium]
MANLDLMKEISVSSPSKIVLVVIDGLGGLPDTKTGKTELETASTPNLDRLAAGGTCGLLTPVAPGITPGSGPGHLALFGYDPITYDIGRGVIEAMGIDFDLQPGDVAARGNFCTVDEKGVITDRRAGRIPTEKNLELLKLLEDMTIDGVRIILTAVKDYRLVAVFRGGRFSAEVTSNDPEMVGVPPKPITALSPMANNLATVVNQFLAKASGILHDQHPANMILLRGFSQIPQIPEMGEVYKLKPAAIASYPMYRGLAKLVGMDVLKTGDTIEDEFETLKNSYQDHDYFFLHVKATDAAGEDGDFERKVRAIEELDRALPALTSLSPDVIAVTGDHSTPAMLKAHSWHPVPVLVNSKWCRNDRIGHFCERACVSGGLGQIPSMNLMPFLMANALKLVKYGA